MRESNQRYAVQGCQFRLDFSVLFVCIFSLTFVIDLFPQKYSFPEIKEIFLTERAQTGDITLREECFASIDDLIFLTFPPLHPQTKEFYTFMINKARLEIAAEEN